MVFGSFDLIHPGHIYFLTEAKKYGDFLIVVIARSSTIEKVKGKRPKYSDVERKLHIRDLKIANQIAFGYEDDKYRIIG